MATGKSSFGVWIAAVAVLTLGGFFLPQRVPLVFADPGDPGPTPLALEFTCASDKAGTVQIYYDASGEYRELDSVSWPVSASREPITYRFPLPHAPITSLRLDPPSDGATLDVRDFRIVDRAGREERRMTFDTLADPHEIAALVPTRDGFAVKSAPGSTDPRIRVDIGSAIIDPNANWINFQRCVVSVGYLAVWLAIAVMAVAGFAFRPAGARAWGQAAAIAVGLGLAASLVANRGLLRESIRWAWRRVPPAPPGLHLEIDVATTAKGPVRVFWQGAQGVEETSAEIERRPTLQIARLVLPDSRPRAVTIDFGEVADVHLRGIRVVEIARRTRSLVPPTLLQAPPGGTVSATAVDGHTDHLGLTEAAIDVLVAGARDPSP